MGWNSHWGWRGLRSYSLIFITALSSQGEKRFLSLFSLNGKCHVLSAWWELYILKANFIVIRAQWAMGYIWMLEILAFSHFLCLPLGHLSEKAMAPHSSTLAWKIPWTEEPGRLQSMGLRRVGHDSATSLSLFTFMHWRRKRQPTPAFLPWESRDGGAWWAAVYGVTQSWTRLKRLSSSRTLITPKLWFPVSLQTLWSSRPRDQTQVSYIAGIARRFFTIWATREAQSVQRFVFWFVCPKTPTVCKMNVFLPRGPCPYPLPTCCSLLKLSTCLLYHSGSLSRMPCLSITFQGDPVQGPPSCSLPGLRLISLLLL